MPLIKRNKNKGKRLLKRTPNGAGVKKAKFNKKKKDNTVGKISKDNHQDEIETASDSKITLPKKAIKKGFTSKTGNHKHQNTDLSKGDESMEDALAFSSEDEEDEEMTGLTKDTLERLKQKDPDFYKYLQNHDKDLLDLDDEDEENVEDILNDEAVNDDNAKEDSAAEKEIKITLNQVKQWRKVLQSAQSSKAEELSAIKSIIKAFRRTVTQTTDSSEDFSPTSMSLLNPSLFNAIINTVLIDLLPAVMRFLRLENTLKTAKTSNGEGQNDEEEVSEHEEEEKQGADSADQLGRGNFFDPRRSRNWKRIQSSIKIYLTDVLKMLNPLSADARASFERHILELTPFYNVFPHLIKRLIRRSIDELCGLGSSTDDSNRVLAYLVLHRTIRVLQSNDHLTVNERQSMVNQILRKLYMSYVGVARNTNESTIAQIGFMKNSLVELYRLDDQLAYQHAFIFIRQLAINLRSSFILNEKNSLKTVYNWQFTHSILLWTQLICSAHNQTDVLDPLISPLVMVISGTIKLLPTVKFLPLRFHLIRALIKLSAETGQFIPVLRYFIEIYTLFDPNKVQQSSKGKNKKGKKEGNGKSTETDSTINELEKSKNKGKSPAPGKSKPSKSKVINFEVMLKVTKEQSTEVEFVEKVFDKFYTLCLQYMVSQSAAIAFPEMVTIFLHQSRKFIQTIRMPNKRTQMKQLVDKIQENSNFIFQKRKSVRFSVLETANITAWEREIRQSESTPLAKFFKQYKTFKVSNVSNKDKRSNAEQVDAMDSSVQNKICAESKGRSFNVESDLLKKQNDKEEKEDDDLEMEMDEEDDIDDELDDEELAQLDDAEDDDDLDEDIEFDEDEEVELDAEQFAKIQKKIEKEEKELKSKQKKGAQQAKFSTSETGGVKRKKKNKNKANKKPRKLNSDLQLEGAFDLSSDDDA